MRVLIVDDSKTMRTIIKGVLGSMGVSEIEEACDGRDALTKVDAFYPDVILCDWNMPVMDGLAFVKQFRGRGSKTPVIMVTTEAEKARVIEAIKAGVNNYAVKPFTPEGLERIIRVTVDKARAAA